MVKRIQHGETEFKRVSLRYPKPFHHRYVGFVGDGILRQVPRHVAEWRAERGLRNARVNDEPYLIFCYRSKRAWN
jgi:hypothetical protein